MAEEIELIKAGPDRALQAPQRIAGEEVFETLDAQHGLFGHVGEALAQGGGLGGHVVGAGDHDLPGMTLGQPGEPGEQCNESVTDGLERSADLQLLDVLGQVSRRHAPMDLLMTGEGREFVDARLHVVPGDRLSRRDRLEVDVVQHGLVGLDRPIGDVDTEFTLGS